MCRWAQITLSLKFSALTQTDCGEMLKFEIQRSGKGRKTPWQMSLIQSDHHRLRPEINFEKKWKASIWDPRFTLVINYHPNTVYRNIRNNLPKICPRRCRRRITFRPSRNHNYSRSWQKKTAAIYVLIFLGLFWICQPTKTYVMFLSINCILLLP